MSERNKLVPITKRVLPIKRLQQEERLHEYRKQMGIK